MQRPHQKAKKYIRGETIAASLTSLELICTSHCAREIREALDEARPIPQRAGPHDVAAMLLAFFASLPAVFMPPAAAQVCDVCVPSVS